MVDHLGLMEAGVVVRYALTYGVAEVNWGTSSVWGRRVLGLLGMVRRGVRVTQVALNPSVILYDAEGHSRGAVDETLQQASLAVADAIAMRMEAGRSFVARLPFHVDERRRQSFLRTSLIAEIYRPLLAGLTASAESGANAVVLAPGGIAGELKRATGAWTPGVRYVGVPSVREGLIVRWGWFALAQLRRLAKGARGTRVSATPTPVGLMSNWGSTGDGPPRDVWWFAATGIARERCAVLFGRSKLESGQVAESAAWLRANGYGVRSMPGAPDAGGGWVDATPGVLTTLRDLLALGASLRLALGSPGGRWQAALLLRTAFHARAWVEVFKREGIRVWFDAADTSPDYAALACDAVGGIKLGLFWSSTVTPIARSAAAHHVRFVPGPAAWTAFEAVPGGADVGLEVGNTYQSADDVERDRTAGAALWASLVSGADDAFVMTLLDRSAGPVNILPTAALLEFYEVAVAYAESDARRRLVVKPKKSLAQTLVDAPALLARVRALEAVGRAAVLGDLRSPLEAAFASDVALALGVSSAGFLTALVGVPTVFSDPSRAVDGPYGAMLDAVGWKRGTTAFDTTADALAAIDAWRADRTIEFGDLGAGARLVDPYADGDSAGRIGMFVRAYVDAIDGGASRASALESASAGFATAHGTDRVRWLA